MPLNEDGVSVTVRTTVDPKLIKDHVNPLNWKTHPERQQTYVSNSISQNGWAGIPLYNANTLKLINGHGRLSICLEKGYKVMPIDVGWWTEEQGNELLITLDTTGGMASIDGNALASLTEATLKRAMKGKKSATPVIGMMTDINSYAQSVIEKNRDNIAIRQSKKSAKKIIGDTKRPKRDELELEPSNIDEGMYETELRTDVLFPSKGNKLGIPDLLPSKLYTNTRILPEDTFDRSGRSLLHTNWFCESSRPFDSQNHMKPKGGFLGFFTEDERFEKYYNKPAMYAEKLIDEQWHAVIEPDYSTYMNWPYAKRLWSVYRSRWCCRYWQQLGIKIIPKIDVAISIEEDEWRYSSLPENTLCLASHCFILSIILYRL